MGIVLNTVQNQPDGTLDLDEVAKVIKPNDPHFAVAKVLALENTSNKLGGLVLPLEYMEKAGDFCERHGLKMHVDGCAFMERCGGLEGTHRPVGSQGGFRERLFVQRFGRSSWIHPGRRDGDDMG